MQQQAGVGLPGQAATRTAPSLSPLAWDGRGVGAHALNLLTHKAVEFALYIVVQQGAGSKKHRLPLYGDELCRMMCDEGVLVLQGNWSRRKLCETYRMHIRCNVLDIARQHERGTPTENLTTALGSWEKLIRHHHQQQTKQLRPQQQQQHLLQLQPAVQQAETINQSTTPAHEPAGSYVDLTLDSDEEGEPLQVHVPAHKEEEEEQQHQQQPDQGQAGDHMEDEQQEQEQEQEDLVQSPDLIGYEQQQHQGQDCADQHMEDEQQQQDQDKAAERMDNEQEQLKQQPGQEQPADRVKVEQQQQQPQDQAAGPMEDEQQQREQEDLVQSPDHMGDEQQQQQQQGQDQTAERMENEQEQLKSAALKQQQGQEQPADCVEVEQEQLKQPRQDQAAGPMEDDQRQQRDQGLSAEQTEEQEQQQEQQQQQLQCVGRCTRANHVLQQQIETHLAAHGGNAAFTERISDQCPTRSSSSRKRAREPTASERAAAVGQGGACGASKRAVDGVLGAVVEQPSGPDTAAAAEELESGSEAVQPGQVASNNEKTVVLEIKPGTNSSSCSGSGGAASWQRKPRTAAAAEEEAADRATGLAAKAGQQPADPEARLKALTAIVNHSEAVQTSRTQLWSDVVKLISEIAKGGPGAAELRPVLDMLLAELQRLDVAAASSQAAAQQILQMAGGI